MPATAVDEKTYQCETEDYQSEIQDEEILSSVVTENRKVIRSRRKFHAFIMTGLVVVFVLGAILGALNAYATSIEVATWKTEKQIQIMDDRIMEMRTALYQDYNNLLREKPLLNAGKDEKGYFVRDNFEVGG
jgi:hypothetical protein